MRADRCTSVLLFLAFLESAQSAKQESVVKDPYDLCRSPYTELKNLSLVEHREYHKPGNKYGGTTEMLQRLFKYQLLYPEALLQRGISNLGELTRLETALQKLASGQPITVVALGGSISAGHGVHDPENAWISRVFTWLEDTFPDADHVLLNRAIPAATSGYVSACVPELVPETTDLVLVEFTYNDHVFGGGSRDVNDASRRGLERLLRRLIAHPNRPGILYLHYWPAARYKSFYDNDEDLIDAVLKYYGIPTLSMRNALHGWLTPELMDQLWWPAPDPKIHPTCIGARMMADLVIGHLQHLIASLQEQPPTETSARLEALADRQPFLLAGNWGHTHTACVLEQDLPQWVRNVQGWTWVDEGKTQKQHKWGYVSLKPSSHLDIQVPLEYVSGMTDSTKEFLVGVGGLISYQHMGSLDLDCSGGCACPALHHNMFHNQSFSMTGWRYLNVTKVGNAPCYVTASNSPETSTGEHKVKLSSLMISAKGEVVEGEERSMLTHAMTNLNSSKAVGDKPIEREYAARQSYRGGDLLDWGSWASKRKRRKTISQLQKVDKPGGYHLEGHQSVKAADDRGLSQKKGEPEERFSGNDTSKSTWMRLHNGSRQRKGSAALRDRAGQQRM